MTTLGPPAARLRVLTYKEGLLSAVAHDLELEVERFAVTVTDERVTVVVEADSVHVRHAMRGGAPEPGLLSHRDLRKIDDNVRRDVLRVGRHPTARFVADAPAADATTLGGHLTLCGVERDVELRLTRDDDHLHVRTRLSQPEFGITPYTAMMGTLRIKAHVDVHAQLPLDALRDGEDGARSLS